MANNYPGCIPDVRGFEPADGEPYRPSNGTEGEFFTQRWCDHCKAESGKDCPILTRTMAFAAGDKGYPQEWQWQKGEPVCTAFDDVAEPITNAERAAQRPLL